MDGHQAQALRAELDAIARRVEATRDRFGSAVPELPIATLAFQHLSAALDSLRKAADEITVGFGLRD